jgi:hypothetical protein
MIGAVLVSLIAATTLCKRSSSPVCTCVVSLQHTVDTLAAAREAFRRSTAIFTGRVLKVTIRLDSTEILPRSTPRRWMHLDLAAATIVVRDRFKGSVPDTVQVDSDFASSCSASLVESTDYLIDALETPWGALYTSDCGFTRALPGAQRLVDLMIRARAH